MKKLIIILAAIAMISCKPIEKIVRVEVPVEVPRITIQKDTIRERTTDSVFMSVKGDTVRIERWRTQFRDRASLKTDTVTKTLTLTKEVPVDVIKEVNKWGFLDWVGLITLILIALFIGFNVFLGKWADKVNFNKH